MGTSIFQFGPLGGEKLAFENLKLLLLPTEIMARMHLLLLSTGCLMKIRLCFGGL